MRNIWNIFKRDLWNIRRNVIALIAIVGITVVPCLYAWFNIAASWDPYTNTGNLKVAIANTDEGYEGSLIPIDLNVGNQVLTALRSNTQMDWVFTNEEKAIDGVQSGKYYAAIVIPKDFSSEIMSVFSEQVEKPELIYYSNAKENAIAPKVTDKGATAIQKQVNQVFIETVSDTTLTVLQTISNLVDESGSESLLLNFASNMNGVADDLTAVNGTLKSLANMTGSAQELLDTTTALLKETETQIGNSVDDFEKAKKNFSGIQETITGTTDGINAALESSQDFYKQVSTVIDEAFKTQSKDADAIADTLNTLASRVDKVVKAYTDMRDTIASIGEKHPELAKVTESIVAKLNGSIATQTELRDALINTGKAIQSTATDLTTAKKELDKLIADSSKGLSEVQQKYESDLKSSLSDLTKSMGTAGTDISSLLTQIDESSEGIYTLADSAGTDLSQLQKALNNSCDLLSNASKKIKDVTGKIGEMQSSGDFSELKALISGDKTKISQFIATPVSLETHKVYSIENYGSSMAPFYSTLAIWIGGIVLVAMIQVSVSQAGIERLQNVKEHHLYLGRQLVFQAIGILQSTLIAAGDLYYLGIQCRHPFLFMLACWITGIIYVNIIYTLTVSFGDIGKAIGVILLVIQVAGTGGTFPIEVTPKFFQVVYPLLPFTHSMAAMREAVGGIYGMTYWIELLKLGIFLILSLMLGLVLRRPIIRLNNAFSEKLEETKIM